MPCAAHALDEQVVLGSALLTLDAELLIFAVLRLYPGRSVAQHGRLDSDLGR